MEAGWVIQSVLLQHFVDVAGLRHVDRQAFVRSAAPHEVDSQIVRQGTHEVDLQFGAQGLLKPPFSLVVGAKVGAVIHIGSKVKFPPCRGSANEQARIVGALGEAQALQNPTESLVPVTGASPEPIKCLSKAPVGAGL